MAVHNQTHRVKNEGTLEKGNLFQNYNANPLMVSLGNSG